MNKTQLRILLYIIVDLYEISPFTFPQSLIDFFVRAITDGSLFKFFFSSKMLINLKSCEIETVIDNHPYFKKLMLKQCLENIEIMKGL